MEYEADRAKDAAGEPSLAEMTFKAIDILAKNQDGFVLMVEGGRIDHASHAGNAYRTLMDTVALNGGGQGGGGEDHPEETLIVITADHSHSLTINGYAKRGNPILGISIGVDGEPILASDGKPYTTLSYANGPGAPILSMPEGAEMEEDSGIILDPKEGRPDPSKVDTTDMNHIQYAAVPLPSETHAGEDLGIYATGPWAHLFQGTVEENYIYHVLDYASKIGERCGQRAKADRSLLTLERRPASVCAGSRPRYFQG